MTTTILVDPDPCADRLEHGGMPVWPARTRDELAAMERFATRFGAALVRVRGQPCSDPRPPTSEELVVAVGAHLRGAAELYAHLTGRGAATVDTHADPPQGTRVVVVDSQRLDRDWLERLHEGGRAPGLIVALDDVSLRRQILLRSAATRLPSLTRQRHARIFALDPRPPQWIEPHRGLVLDLDGSASAIATICDKGVDVLSITSHCDGLDANLRNAVLCPMDRSPIGDLQGAPPRCVASGHCHRFDRPLADVLGTEQLLHPERIAARVLVFNACWGAILSPYLFDPRWTVWARLLEQPELGALVASVGVVYASASECDRFDDVLASEPDLGRALARYRHERTSPEALRYYLFGDPRVALASASATAARMRPLPGDPVASQPSARGSFLHEHLAALDASGPPTQWGAQARAGLDCELDERVPFSAELRDALLRTQAERGPLLVHSWANVARVLDVRLPPTRCLQCGSPIELTIFAERTEGRWQRRLGRCDCCGVVSDDAPDDGLLRVRLQPPVVTLVGAEAMRDWSALLLVWPRRDAPRVVLQWPATADGHPAPSLQLPDPLPYGRIEITLLLATGRGLRSTGSMFMHTDTAALKRS